MFVEVAEKSKDDKATSRACSDLGAMFNSLVRRQNISLTYQTGVTVPRLDSIKNIKEENIYVKKH